jgi:uncharacterized protein
MRRMKAGLGWRTELGAGIVANLDRIDVVEVMAEDFFDAPRAAKRALRFLGSQVPLVVHATSLGLAGSDRVDRRALDRVARVVDWLQPESWSEHLAFVRAAGREVGHLAAPPRNDTTLHALAENVIVARRVVGSAPLLENVATLVQPPLSTYDEASWLSAVAETCETRLLLDLHNLHANAANFHFDAGDAIDALDPTTIGMIHIAGGRRIDAGRILDDHCHPVPDPVYSLLGRLHAPHAPVVLERDGRYPAIDDLLGELDRARDACSKTTPRTFTSSSSRTRTTSLASAPVDSFLALLYTNEEVLSRFLAHPLETARAHALGDEAASALAALPPDDVRAAARGFARKRFVKAVHGR